jgi:ABC-type sugar transport system substrate-binding protein
VTADWTESGGERAVAAWLRLKTEGRRPDLIGAQNDAMAVGARRAARARDAAWGSASVLGCDALPEGGRQLVGAAELGATVVLPSSAGPAVDLVGRWLQTKAIPPAEVMLAPQGFSAKAHLAPVDPRAWIPAHTGSIGRTTSRSSSSLTRAPR